MTYENLCTIKNNFAKFIEQRKQAIKLSKSTSKKQILICGGGGCASGKSLQMLNKLWTLVKDNHAEDKVNVVVTGCFGLCARGPLMIVYPEGVFYGLLTMDKVERIFQEHILGNKVVTEYLSSDAVADGKYIDLFDTDFYKKQLRIALRNCSKINPWSIEEYIAQDGYFALYKCLKEYNPKQVIDIVKASGLKGRGGAGFPTGLKWELTAKVESKQKYVICNADEGDPGAFMDRSILEGDPHSVLEAMAIAGYCIGANKGYIYVRAEYPIQGVIQNAIDRAVELGVLGKNIFGTKFCFDIEIRLGAGAFVCGEETALIASIEGGRGTPRTKPPYPAEKGLFGKPTVINNVETWANINPIIMKGAEWFASIGSENAKGTKVFALSGKTNNTGLIEVPFGTTLREIIYDIGGGIPNGKKFKAAQIGGPSGGCIPYTLIDTKMDYDSLGKIGSMVGSGGLIVLDEDSCMVDIAKYYLGFILDESCGKCTPCRIGNRRMYEILESISNGTAKLSDLDKLRQLASYVKETSLCGLGKSAPNPILSTIRYFEDEYKEHIIDKKCRAGVCKGLIKYTIDTDKCKKCGICAAICPQKAIVGDRTKGYVITDKCIKCGLCYAKCPFGAIIKK